MVEQSSPQAKLYPHRGDADFDEEMWRTAEKFPRKRTAEEGIGGPEGRGAAATPPEEGFRSCSHCCVFV